MRYHLVVALSLLAAGAGQAEGQTFLSARGEFWSIASGGMGSTEIRPGLALALGAGESDAVFRASYGLVPQGHVAPGWMTLAVELEPRIELEDFVSIGLRFHFGGFRMNVSNRQRVAAGCTPENYCMFEARGYENGWSSQAGVALTGSVRIAPRAELTGGYGRSKLLFGANSEESLSTLSAGLQFRMR